MRRVRLHPAIWALFAGRGGDAHVRDQGSHAVYVSQPQAVAAIIAKAAAGVTLAAR